jgi:hypothetical protein
MRAAPVENRREANHMHKIDACIRIEGKAVHATVRCGGLKTKVTYGIRPPRKMQSVGYTGPITLSAYQRFSWIREQLEKEGFNIPMPSGN